MFRVVRRSARRSARRFARREEKKKKRGVCATQRRLRKSRESCVTRRIDRGRAAPSAARSSERDARGIPENVRGSKRGARPSVGARPRARKHARDVGRCPAISSEKRGETIANFPGTRTRRVAGSVGPDVPPGLPVTPSRRRLGECASPRSVSARSRASRGRSTRPRRRARWRFRDARHHRVVSARWRGASSRRRRAARPRSWSTRSRSRRTSRDARSLPAFGRAESDARQASWRA